LTPQQQADYRQRYADRVAPLDIRYVNETQNTMSELFQAANNLAGAAS